MNKWAHAIDVRQQIHEILLVVENDIRRTALQLQVRHRIISIVCREEELLFSVPDLTLR